MDVKLSHLHGVDGQVAEKLSQDPLLKESVDSKGNRQHFEGNKLICFIISLHYTH
jgi:hypothetical protein